MEPNETTKLFQEAIDLFLGGRFAGGCNFAARAFEKHSNIPNSYRLMWSMHAVCLQEDYVIDFTAKQFGETLSSPLILPKDEYVYWIVGALREKHINFPMLKWDEMAKLHHITNGFCESFWSPKQRFSEEKYCKFLELLQSLQDEKSKIELGGVCT